MESTPPSSPSFGDEQFAGAFRDLYEIEREIGRGGMATVYLARDRRHNRKVALKVLNAELGAVIGVDRFLAEIQVTANLQHPNILPLYDSGSGNGLLFYVMPYVEGESLRDRLNRERQLPIDDALRITTAVAGALDYAHRNGIVHRDLKPENILLQDGQPLVADFGIALAVTNAGGSRITQTGLSLGTPQYMSPEQATGERVIDGRTDLYSLGCVLYEMLAGDPPHLGGSAQAVIAKLLTEKPASVRTVRTTVPPHVDYAIERALAKVPADRWSTAREFADSLAGRTIVPATPEPRARDARRRVRRNVLLAVPWVLAAGGAAALLLTENTERPAARSAVMYASLPGASLADGFAVSRDGSALAYVGVVGSSKELHVRPIGQLDGHALAGTAGAQQPVWSPDGRRLAFAANGKVLRIGRDGGAIEVISPAQAFGHDWLDNEAMIIGSSVAGTGLRVATHAGAPLLELTKPETQRGEMFHTMPLTLPRGRIAFVSWGPGGLEDDFLAIADASSGKYLRSSHTALQPIALIGDWLVYQSEDRRLMAVRCDLGAMRFRGEPVTLMEDVVAASVSSGTALFLSGVRTTSLALIEPGQRGETRILAEDAGTVGAPRVAPNGRHVAYVVTRRDGSDLAMYDIRAGTSTVLRKAAYLADPAWLPNGREVVYYEGGADSGLWRMPVDRPTERTLVTAADFPRQPNVSPDGESMVFMASVLAAGGKRWYALQEASLAGPASPRAVAPYRWEQSQPAISPNGRWLAHGSLETGRNEVFIRGFRQTRPGPPVRVSVHGGFEPRWSRDGRRLFYRVSRVVMMATLRETAGSLDVVARDSVASFTLASASEYDLLYDVGTRDEILVATANEKTWQLVFAQNWAADAEKRLAASRR